MPYGKNLAPPLAAQSAALRTLARVADEHPDLPGAYVVSHSVNAEQIDVQLDNPSGLETWRTSLGVANHTVSLTHYDARHHLDFTVCIGTTLLRVYAVFPDTSTTPEGRQA